MYLSTALTLGIYAFLLPAGAHFLDVRGPASDLVARDNHTISSPFSAEPQQQSIQRCATTNAPPELRDSHVYYRENPTKHLDKRVPQQIIIQTHIHIVATDDQANYYANKFTRNDLVQAQMIALNNAYRPAHIAFALSGTTFTIKNTWATDQNSTAMKSALRNGGYSHLNIYFQTNLSTAPYTYQPGGASTLLGYCTLPTKMTYDGGDGTQVEFPREDYATDGCSVLAGSMPGVGSLGVPRGYTEGKTAVHEVGHWFGLLHTFQDTTCDPTDAGDYCDDTPQESVSTEGCPTNPPKDSCPSCAGTDPVHNFMDYSTDECYTNFSPDQQIRMQNLYNLYRKGE